MYQLWIKVNDVWELQTTQPKAELLQEHIVQATINGFEYRIMDLSNHDFLGD
jgi:hypothetical protein